MQSRHKTGQPLPALLLKPRQGRQHLDTNHGPGHPVLPAPLSLQAGLPPSRWPLPGVPLCWLPPCGGPVACCLQPPPHHAPRPPEPESLLSTPILSADTKQGRKLLELRTAGVRKTPSGATSAAARHILVTRAAWTEKSSGADVGCGHLHCNTRLWFRQS